MVGFSSPYTIAIVGAASGIGRSAAMLMAVRGASVICLDRDADGAVDAAGEIVAAGGKAQARTIEITDAGSQSAVWQAVIKDSGQLHAVVNCAGVTGATNLKAHQVDPDDFDLVYRINLFGPLLISQAVLPHMLEKNYGRILHLASIAGKEGNAGMAAYSATKAGVIGLVKSMGKDYAETGITINALAPAVIRTPMVAAMPEQQVRYMTDKIPMKRCGELEEAADMIAWIVSPACSHVKQVAKRSCEGANRRRSPVFWREPRSGFFCAWRQLRELRRWRQRKKGNEAVRMPGEAATKLVHGGTLRSQFGETSEAIFLNSGYVYDSAEQAEARFKGDEEGYVYSRYANPTVAMFETRMCLLEGAEAARGTATGMAAVAASLLSHLKAGDHVVSARALFGSCRYIVEDLLPRYGIATTLIDGRDLKAWERAMQRNTRAVFFETPTNPTLELSISRRWQRSRMRAARSWWWTMCSPRRSCNGRCRSAPTSSSIPPPSISTVRGVASAAWCLDRRTSSRTRCTPSSSIRGPR